MSRFQTLDASSLFAYDGEGRKLSADSGAGICANPSGGVDVAMT